MKRAILKWVLIVLLILFAPLIYTVTIGYLTANAGFPVMKVFSVKSKTALAIIFTSFNLICAIITTSITALPCGYMAPKQAKIIAILFIISILSIPIYVFTQEPKAGSFVTTVWLGQVASVVVTAFVFSKIGSRIAAKRQNNANV